MLLSFVLVPSPSLSSLPFPSLPFPSLLFPFLPFPFLPSPSLHFPSLALKFRVSFSCLALNRLHHPSAGSLDPFTDNGATTDTVQTRRRTGPYCRPINGGERIRLRSGQRPRQYVSRSMEFPDKVPQGMVDWTSPVVMVGQDCSLEKKARDQARRPEQC